MSRRPSALGPSPRRRARRDRRPPPARRRRLRPLPRRVQAVARGAAAASRAQLPPVACRAARPAGADDEPGLRVHSPFSGKTRFLPHLRQDAFSAKMLKNSDDASGRVLTVDDEDDGQSTPVLVDPLTGDATPLPPLPPRIDRHDAQMSTNGVACRNGVVVFCARAWPATGLRLPTTLLRRRPGEADWEKVTVPNPPVKMGVEYGSSWDARVHRARAAMLCSSGVLRGGACAMAEPPPKPVKGDRYVLESQGELLCVDINLNLWRQRLQPGETTPALASIHALEVRGGGMPPEWVKKETGRGSGGDHVCLFLDWKTSSGFAVDAREFTGADEITGGCAYVIDMARMTLESDRNSPV
ncbi:hypothetical protein ACP4OV_005394 [Aristida adscensionis]